ncbi:MAG: divalent metal cation transporter [Actinobacteria bacterium]|nr:divalent metal cation transporter [Actinomycetota bacterium]MCL6105091.1 divalent metal cation transporter [Actinomycetota bacterium]
MGPGIIVMLADTDVGSITTAAQSGAEWKYRLLLIQLIFIPILYIVQELTVRLGIFTGKGHGQLIREKFGIQMAWISIAGLTISVVGALFTEFAGIVGVGELFGIPRVFSLLMTVAFLLLIAWTGSYRQVEKVAIALGLFELVFFGIAIAAHPHMGALARESINMPFGNSSYMYLIAANIGAIIMPWMIFYQQSAIADKGLQPESYREARLDTAIGAVITQLIMIAVLIAVAATIGQKKSSGTLVTVGEISRAITPFLGKDFGHLLFGVGVLGAAMVAAIVVSLAIAWGFGEVTNYKHSLEHRPLEAPWFYLIYSLAVIGGALVVLIVHNLVSLIILVEVVNALLLPLVLGFLVMLAIKALPKEHRISGWYRWMVVAIVAITATLGVYAALIGLI